MRILKSFRTRKQVDQLPPAVEFDHVDDVVSAYNSGFEGAVYDPEAAEEVESAEYGKGEIACREFDLEEKGKGKLTLLYAEVWKAAGRNDFYHGKQSQPCGDCCSRGQTHAAMASLGAAVTSGHGSWPTVPDEVYKYGMVFHPSPVYWLRAHGGDGWSCGQAALRSKDGIGLVVCAKYEDLGLDLTVYNTATAHKWGSRKPPEEVISKLNSHCTLEYSRISGYEQCRDMIASGYGINSCGGEAWASATRDANGVIAHRSGHWSHSLAYVGFDDTEWAHKNYGGPLVCILNSWGTGWIKGPRKVQGGDHAPEIPGGAFWARWADVQGRDMYAISSVKGFPPMRLPDWSLRDLV